jgi:hypothetical protein
MSKLWKTWQNIIVSKCYNSLTLFKGSSSVRHLQVQQAGVQLPGDPRQLVQASLRSHQRSKLTSGASQISSVSNKKYYNYKFEGFETKCYFGCIKI